MLNLDTHILIAILDGSLDADETRLVLRNELAISDIVLWEIAKLVQIGRLVLDLESPDCRRSLRALRVFPITSEIALNSTRLDFSSDPADELIAATSIVESIPLLTRDERILGSDVVPFPVR